MAILLPSGCEEDQATKPLASSVRGAVSRRAWHAYIRRLGELLRKSYTGKHLLKFRHERGPVCGCEAPYPPSGKWWVVQGPTVLPTGYVGTLAGVPLYGYVDKPPNLPTYACHARRRPVPLIEKVSGLLTWFTNHHNTVQRVPSQPLSETSRGLQNGYVQTLTSLFSEIEHLRTAISEHSQLITAQCVHDTVSR